MDDFTQDENIKMSEETLWLVHGRDDVNYKASWAQRRLLEKKNARKRKQEEASAALKSIDVQSAAKKSPVKNRYPLSPKNDNDPVGAKLPPVAKPRTDSGSEKRHSAQRKNQHSGRGNGKDLEEILDSGRKSQIFTSSKQGRNEMKQSHHSVDVPAESQSIQERMARFKSQNGSTEYEIPDRNFKQTNECKKESRNHSNSGTPTGKNERSSGSISGRLAIFETASSHSGKGSPVNASPKSNNFRHTPKSNQSSVGDRAITKSKTSESNRLSAKLKKTSTMKETNCDKNELKTPLTPQLDSITNADESCDFDYNSDENPFDISSILRAANEGETQESEATEFTKASWNVMDYLTEDSPKIDNAKKGRQRDSVYSNCGDEDMSGFAKEIAKKRRAIKSPSQEESIRVLDSNLKEKTLNLVKEEHPKKNPVEKSIARSTPDDLMKKSRQGAKEKSEQKRKAPKEPNESDIQSQQKQIVKHNEQVSKGERIRKSEPREAPPKPPRKGKCSVDEPANEMKMEKVVNETVNGGVDVTDATANYRDDKRKRDWDEGSQYVLDVNVNGNILKSADGYLHDERPEHDVKKVKQGRKQIASDIESYNRPLPEIQEDVPPIDTVDEVIFSPNSKTYQSVREKKSSKSRKGMRRSMSFSEGQAQVIPVIHKSGYNEETSAMYNVVTSCASPAKEEEKSTNDRIKELLDYAVSQQNIVIQASQALNLSLNGDEKKGCPEIIEGERLLLLAGQRRTACLEEVDRLKQPGEKHKKANGSEACLPCKATLVISEIKLPLNADFLVALRGGRMDLGVFHFVILIQHGPTQIYSTKVRCTYDELSRNFLTFNDKIILKDVPHDFVLSIKVFGMHTRRAADAVSRGKKTPQSKESPGLMKNMFSSLTPRRRMNSADESPARGSSPKPVFRSTNFTAVGHSTINLSSQNSGRFVLNQVPKNCPLDGFVDMNLDCLPEYTASARGFLTILEEVGGFTAWNRRWCVMNGDLISFWRFPDEENLKPPTATIDLRFCCTKTIDVVPRMECSRPNTFELSVKRPITKHDAPSLLSTIEGKAIHTKYWVSADNKEDRIAWVEVLNRQLSDSRAWSSKPSRSKAANGHSKDEQASQRRPQSAVAV